MTQRAVAVKVYIAGRFEDRAFLSRQAKRLQEAGCTVVSSWLWVDAGSTVRPNEADALAMAERDLGEIEEADALIVDTRKVAPRGGREVELGYALARNLVIIRIGPRRNIFHTRARHTYTSWAAFWRDLKKHGVKKHGVV